MRIAPYEFFRQMFLANVFAWERQASAWLLLRADQTVSDPGTQRPGRGIFPAGKNLVFLFHSSMTIVFKGTLASCRLLIIQRHQDGGVP